jgi:hypothetical protein
MKFDMLHLKDMEDVPATISGAVGFRRGFASANNSDFIASLGEQRAVELFSEVSGMSLKPIMTGLPL